MGPNCSLCRGCILGVVLRYLENHSDEVEMLGRDECLLLLGKTTRGRVGLSIRGLPAVVLVRFCLLDDHIVVHTRDAKLADAVRGHVVAFEADDLDDALGGRWSVVVTGQGFAIEARGEGHDVVGITTELISGRRLLESA